MATKKTTTKKAPAPKKQSTARKSTPKKSAASTQVAARSSLSTHVGLRREDTAFMTFRITRQTLYWFVLGIVVVMFTVWLMRLQSDIQDLYDQIDASTAQMSAL